MIKKFLKKYWDRLMTLLNTFAWFGKTIRFLKVWGVHIVNIIILSIAYTYVKEGTLGDFLVGLWLFILLVYYLMWKLLGAERLFQKDED